MRGGWWRFDLAWRLTIVAAASVSCAGSSQDKPCTEIGCSSGAAIDATLDVEYDDLRSAAITVCRNDTCVTGVLIPPTNEPMTHEGVVATIEGADSKSHVSRLTLSSDGGSWRVHLDWQENSRDALHDGDAYRLSLTSTQGAALAMLSGHATYQDSQPNGPDCDPTCRFATVKL